MQYYKAKREPAFFSSKHHNDDWCVFSKTPGRRKALLEKLDQAWRGGIKLEPVPTWSNGCEATEMDIGPGLRLATKIIETA